MIYIYTKNMLHWKIQVIYLHVFFIKLVCIVPKDLIRADWWSGFFFHKAEKDIVPTPNVSFMIGLQGNVKCPKLRTVTLQNVHPCLSKAQSFPSLSLWLSSYYFPPIAASPTWATPTSPNGVAAIGPLPTQEDVAQTAFNSKEE